MMIDCVKTNNGAYYFTKPSEWHHMEVVLFPYHLHSESLPGVDPSLLGYENTLTM